MAEAACRALKDVVLSNHGVILGSLDLLLVGPFQLGIFSDSMLFFWDCCPCDCNNKETTSQFCVSRCTFLYLSMPISNDLVFSFLSLTVRSFNISWLCLGAPAGA